MTKRIFYSVCLASISVFLASIVLFLGALYSYFSNIQRMQLRIQTQLAAQGVSNEGASYFDGLDAQGYRITWIGQDGDVLYDSESNADEMENHLERQEIRQALVEGMGESGRYSSTLMERSFYCARRLEDGTILRLSIAQHSLLTLILGMSQPIFVIFLVAILLALFLAFRFSKRIVEPLNDLNLDEPMKNEGYDELTLLFRRMDAQQRQIRRQSYELQQKQREFEAVTNGMAEGIILLNGSMTILSINQAAARLLGTDRSCEGKNMLTVNRSLELQNLLAEAQKGRHAETVMEFDSALYQFDASPVTSGGRVSGAVLLMLDVTERERSGQMRREFTANVSHELKTPLHTISGCAELLANGMVKQEDVAPFSGQIYAEAQRMTRLIEDIIGLSRLDEGAVDLERKACDLYLTAQKTLDMLQTEAEEASVSLRLEGEHAAANSVLQLIEEILYNLCDNAIKYNRKGGSVVVTVKQEEHAVSVSVEDTGIGIPPEHQERIFERFYRVDKSHSREIGGTGLGLSIVRHAAKLLDAEVELESAAGVGTKVTVRFPPADRGSGRFQDRL